MRTSSSLRWLVVAVSAAMLLAVAAACSSETVEVPGETVVVEKEVVKTVEVPGETVTVEVVKEVQVPGETVVVEKVVTETVEVPGETVVVEKEVVKTVEVPGETVTVEVVKEVQVPGETVVVEKEVVKTVVVPGETVVVEKVVTETVQVPGETVVVEKEVVKTVEVPGETVVVKEEVVKTVEVPGPERVVVKEVAGKKYVTDPSTGEVVIAPEYGGTLNLGVARDHWGGHPDPWYFGPETFSAVYETLGIPDWAIDRNEVPYGGGPVPLSAVIGNLAQSWEMPDDTTISFNIRQGVYWHDKAPMNGRELNANDVAFSFHRYLGMGNFTEPGPWHFKSGPVKEAGVESITATDDSTVVFKLKTPHLDVLRTILTEGAILPPEVIEEHGDITNWRNLVGTGPYELTEWVEGSSYTFDKNPNYWAYDEKYPANLLPYIDRMKFLEMPDGATRLAALRSGKVDLLSMMTLSQITSIDVVASLRKTNPELELWPFSLGAFSAFHMNVSKPPFDDIRVRHAMQMALDLETINATYWKGLADTTPAGPTGPMLAKIGYAVPFEQWPEELQGYFTYDLEGAEALLDAAGHRRGADGIRFKTAHNFKSSAVALVPFFEIAVEQWREIGVEVELIPLGADFSEILQAHTYEGMMQEKTAWNSRGWLNNFVSDANWNIPAVQDPGYDAIVEDLHAASTLEEQMRLSREADTYAVEQHWTLFSGITPWFNVNQPWVVGYNGEFIPNWHYGQAPARIWIDSELKESMGR